MAISKVIYGGDTLIDITDSTIESSNMLNGTVGYNSAGVRTVGSYVDSDENVKQTPDTSNNDLRILLSNSANDTEETNIVKKNTNLKYNPSTGNLQTTKINGITVGNSPKFTDTNTTYTFAEGATNGAFTVTPSTSGATAQTVNIHGLGSAAYTASTDYIASSNNGLQTIKVTRGTSVSTATHGYWAAMCSSSQTGSPTLPTSGKWWHVLSMDWSDTDEKAWWSQLALPTRDGDGVWYRKSDNTNTIDNISWNRLADGDSSGNANNALKVNNLEVKTAVPENAVFTDTWRNIKVNGSEKFGNATSTGAVDFVNGTGTTVTYTSSGKKISINTTYGTEANTACQGNDSRLSDARTPTSHPHGNITNDGKITSDTAQASGDKLVIIDADNNKVARSKIALSATVSSQSQTTKFLREDGTWSAPTYTTISAATSNAYGGIKIGFTQTEKKYPVQLSSGKAYVEVPWTDTSGNDKVAKAGDTMTGNLKIGTSTTSSIFDAGLEVHDIRNANHTPAGPQKALNFFFSKSDMPNTSKWWGGLFVKPWTTDYSAWELVGTAHTGDNSTVPLYVRTSNGGTSWGSWRQIYDSSNKPSKTDVGLENVANIDQSKAIKNITRSGTTFTATCLDNTTFEFTQQDNNTKNTTGTSNLSDTKLFLAGATSQTDGVKTYSNSKVYIDTNNCLYSNSKQVVNLSDSQALTNKTYNGYTLGTACAKNVPASGNASSTEVVMGNDTRLSAATSSANGLMSSTDKSKLDGIRVRSCIVGQSANTTNNPWFKFATLTASTANGDWIATFLVEDTYGAVTGSSVYSTNCAGIFRVRIRTGKNSNNKAIPQYCEMKFIAETGYVIDGTNTDDFLIVHQPADTENPIYELWTRIAYGYKGRRFTIIDEGNRANVYGSTFTLVGTGLGTGQSAVTSGYTRVYAISAINDKINDNLNWKRISNIGYKPADWVEICPTTCREIVFDFYGLGATGSTQIQCYTSLHLTTGMITASEKTYRTGWYQSNGNGGKATLVVKSANNKIYAKFIEFYINTSDVPSGSCTVYYR